MKTINSLSGGKTSSYIAKNYPADYNLFSLIRTNDKSCLFPDSKIRQIVSDKINTEFIGTLEMDEIIYTMLDLEQYIGQEIIWLSPTTFDEIIVNSTNNIFLPSIQRRFCTVKMKVEPIAQWCYENTELPIEMRIGFRPNEQNRAKIMLEKPNINNIQTYKFNVGKHKNGNNKWKTMPYRKLAFPLIENRIFKDTIEKYWSDKPVRFAYMNNCVGCFHRNPMLLKHMSNKCENKFDWFVKQEKSDNCYSKWLKEGITYENIKKRKTQLRLFDDDFNECDSGYCGL